MSSIAKPISRPPMRLAASVPSGSVGSSGLSNTPRPQRSQAPTAAPPPTANNPPQGTPLPQLAQIGEQRRGRLPPDQRAFGFAGFARLEPLDPLHFAATQ